MTRAVDLSIHNMQFMRKSKHRRTQILQTLKQIKDGLEAQLSETVLKLKRKLPNSMNSTVWKIPLNPKWINLINVTNMKDYFKNMDSNMEAQGNVFDSVKNAAETNTRVISRREQKTL